jgi:EH domain-containing protein 1
MWYLGKVMQTPEVVRVYVGSFWNNPYQNKENEKLFDAERDDLFKDLFSLPKYAALRKVNELVKRARLTKVHAYIIAHLAGEMPSFFYKDKKKEELIANLKNEFFKVHQKHQLPVGDFPDINRFREMLKVSDFTQFAKLNEKLIERMDVVLSEDIPKLLKQFPEKRRSDTTGSNPFESTNPFDANIPSQVTDPMDAYISPEDRVKYREQFNTLTNNQPKLPGKAASEVMMKSNLPREVLSKIWLLSDIDKDGNLNEHEFLVSMYLINNSLKGNAPPTTLPEPLLKPKATPF